MLTFFKSMEETEDSLTESSFNLDGAVEHLVACFCEAWLFRVYQEDITQIRKHTSGHISLPLRS